MRTPLAGELIPAVAVGEAEGLFPQTREAIPHGEAGESAAPVAVGKWTLRELKPVHKQVASYVAQGLKNVEIAQLCNITPEYVSMLLRQPLVREYIAEMCDVVGVRLEALFEQSVDVIADTMQHGTANEKLKAARLQLEATKRIGRPDPNAGLERGSVDRLEQLADRLLALQSNIRKGNLYDEKGTEISEA